MVSTNGTPANTAGSTASGTPSSTTATTGVVGSTGTAGSTTSVASQAIAIGLSLTKTCTTAKDVAHVIAKLVSERFALPATKTSDLKKDMTKFFSKASVTNEEIFSFMIDSSSWPDPSKAGPNGGSLQTITMPVVLLLSQLAFSVRKMLQAGYFLDSEVKYSDFEAWIASLSSPAPSGPSSSNDHKIPSFKVPTFRGDSISSDTWMEDVVRCFSSNCMAQYIKDESFCAQHIQWSSAFASRIRESIASSDILSFIATEQDTEQNCAKLWKVVQTKLTSADLKMARAMSHWNLLFGLKCDDLSGFLAFYNKVKSTIWKLKMDKSVAVGDDTFLRAYLAKVIEVPELQTEVKKLISDSSGTYETILELIYADYRAQETGDNLRDSTSSSTLSLRRSKTESPPVKDVKPRPPRFPSNEFNLLPTHFYTQFRTWYQHMSVPKEERSEETLEWMKSFKFDFRNPNSRRDGSRFNGRDDRDRKDAPPRRSGDLRDDGQRRGRRAMSSRDDYDHERSRSRSRSRDRDPDYDAFLDWKADRSRNSRRSSHRGDSEPASDDDNKRRRRVAMFGGRY